MKTIEQEDIIAMAREAGFTCDCWLQKTPLERFAALVSAAEREACIDIIETYRIPVGNSAAGELACEWTYDALKTIRDDIRSRK